jgi:hypothetical protein
VGIESLTFAAGVREGRGGVREGNSLLCAMVNSANMWAKVLIANRWVLEVRQ